MATTERHRWEFASCFRRNAFGWRSQPAIQRVREAVSEIRKVRGSNPMLAAEGAVLFLEKVSPALEHVDSSSGAISNAVNRAIEELVPVIAQAPTDEQTRSRWLERLWEAYTADQTPYIETVGEFWGELCASQGLLGRPFSSMSCGRTGRIPRSLFPRHAVVVAGSGTTPRAAGAARQSAPSFGGEIGAGESRR